MSEAALMWENRGIDFEYSSEQQVLDKVVEKYKKIQELKQKPKKPQDEIKPMEQ